MRDLRFSDVAHMQTNTKNVHQTTWSTVPTRRIDRSPRLKPMHFNARSGFNKKVDDPSKLNVLDQPVSAKQLSASTLKCQTKKQLKSLVSPQNLMIHDEDFELDHITEESIANLYQT